MENSHWIVSYILPAFLFMIMLGMGMMLVPDDFRRILKTPKAGVLGLLGQVVLLPLLAFSVAWWMQLSASYAIGLMLLASCPGGTTSNLFTFLAKGDTALSITLTAVSSMVAILTLPLILGISYLYLQGEGLYLHLPVQRVLFALIFLTLVPVCIGMYIRYRFPAFSQRQEKLVTRGSSIFLAVLVGGLVLKERNSLGDAIVQCGLAALLLNATCMLVGHFLGKRARLSASQTTAITLEVGLQNSALAIVIATSILMDSKMALMPAVYSLVMNFSAVGYVWWRRKVMKLEETMPQTRISEAL